MKKILITIIIIGLVAAIFVYFRSQISAGEGPIKLESSLGLVDPQALAEIPQYQYTETYVSADYRLSFRYPAGFDVSGFIGDNNYVILVQNLAEKISLQIVISKFTECGTPQCLRKLTDMAMSDMAELMVAGVQGISFVGNNPNFGGSSREIWFTRSGYLYQMSTYEKFGAFAQGLAAAMSDIAR